MKRIPSLIAVAVLSVASLSACGGGGDEFCDKAKDADTKFSGVDPTDADTAEAFNDLADSAPDEIKEEMDNIASAFDDIQNLTPEDIESLTADSEKITTYLSDECGIDAQE